MDPASVFPRLPELVDGDAGLVRRGRFLSLSFIARSDDLPFHVTVAAGRVIRVERGPLLLRPSAFTVRAAAATWRRFWEPVPKPGWHDLFALIKAGRAEVEGDLLPFMANLQYFKDLLATPRRLAGGG